MKTFFKIFFGSLLGCIAAAFLFLFIMIGVIGSASIGQKTPTMASSAILKIDFKAQVVEHNIMGGAIGLSSLTSPNRTISILDLVRAIKYAESDPAIKFLYLNVDNANLSKAHAEELRDALEEFRQSGKAIIAYASSFNNTGYYLASVADKVIMHSFGGSEITGLSTTIVFFKDLLDKLGINVQLVRHGKYKAAAEQFTSSNISAENYEQNKALIDNIWDVWCDDICASREISKEYFNSLVDNLQLVDAQSMLAYGLIDEAFYQEELDQYLCRLFDVTQVDDINYISVDYYAQFNLINDLKAQDKIAILYAEGEIIDGESTGLQGGAPAIIGSKFVKEINKLREDDDIKAVVLRVNSPGGSAHAAEMIRHSLQLLRSEKPLVVSFGEYAASGGYWISAESDKIFTDKTTITGSIGVFSMIPSLEKSIQKLDLNAVTINSNKHSNIGIPTKDLDSEKYTYIQKSVEKIYTEFTNLIASGRNMSVSRVDEIGQGRVWSGTDAVDLGLADCHGGIVDALEYAQIASGVERYSLVEVPVNQTPLEMVLELLNETQAKVSFPNSLENISNYFKVLQHETKSIILARLPFIYELQ